MNDTHIETLEQVRGFLEGTEAVCFEIESKEMRYRWTEATLVKFRYLALGKAEKGLLTRYIRKMTGYSLAQVKRLIKQYRERGRLERKQRTVQGFSLKYTRADLGQLMECWMEDIRINVHGDEQLSAEDEQVKRAEDQEQRAALAKLASCISQLPDQDGIFIKLRYHKNIPVAEIGDLFATKEATVYKRLKRALQKLKKCIEDER